MALQHRWGMRVFLLCSAFASATCQLDDRSVDVQQRASEGASTDAGAGASGAGEGSGSSGAGGRSSSSSGSAGEVSFDPLRDAGLNGSSADAGGSDAGLQCAGDAAVCEPALECLRDSDCPLSAPHCDDSNSCIACLTDDECDDGTFCNGAEICNSQGQCVDGPLPCVGPDGDADCSESCAEDTRDCTGNDPRASACAGGGSCDGAGACRECLNDADCSTPRPFCDGAGACAECVEDAHCSDGTFCNGAETCNAQGNCAQGSAPCPGPDGDADCSEMCDETADACTGNDPANSPCSAGLCTGSGVCAQCLNDAQCPTAAPHCLGTICVECLVDGHCPSPTCTRGVCGQANRCSTVVVCGP